MFFLKLLLTEINFFNQRHSNTLTTNTITCGILLGAGDVIQQRLEKAMGKETPHKHDASRTGETFFLFPSPFLRYLTPMGSVLLQYNFTLTGRMFLVGLSQGPPHHYWYIWLDKYLPKRNLRTVSWGRPRKYFMCYINIMI